MTIRILSLDFDGCLFNRKFIDTARDAEGNYIGDVIKANKAFLDLLKEKKKNYSRTIAIVGSNRQCYRTDAGNSTYYKPSCFPELEKIAAELEIEYDTFLLADLYGDLPLGTSFRVAKEALNLGNKGWNIEHHSWVFDDSKISLMYAQIHKTALDNPNEEIDFEFYDDRLDILEHLKNFFYNGNLLPKNVTLKLHQYAGESIKEFATIKGTGMIDANYKNTIKQMSNLLNVGQKAYAKCWNFSVINPEDLTERTAYTAERTTIEPSSLIQHVDNPFVKSPLHKFSIFAPADLNKEYPASYKKMWNQEQISTPVQQIMTLLRDYTKEDFFLGSWWGLFFSWHLGRHHVAEVQKIINHQYTEVEDIYRELKQIECKSSGSLSRRIQFIETQLGERTIAPESEAKPNESAFVLV